MRKLKFRVWDKLRKEMLSSQEIELSWLPNECLLVNGDDRIGDADYGSFILMQFTGLHDKNGKEIYEGDILDNAPQMIRICWDTIGGKWFGHYVDKKRTSSFWLGSEFKNYKVIGNIYENPELLTPTPK